MTLATYSAVEDEIRSRVLSNLTTGGDGGDPVPTFFENLGWFTADSVEVDEPDSGLRLKVAIRFGRAFQVDLGEAATTTRRSGVLMATAIDDVGSGEDAILGLVDRFCCTGSPFLKVTANGIVWRVPYPSSRTREGSTWRAGVSCPFQSDVIE